MAEVCRRWGVPLLVVPDGDPNSPEFISDMRSRWDPDVALSYWSLTIFRDAWIGAFTHSVNFHDGLIPDHRGVGATTMEVYEGLETGGFTFHHIDTGIDTGNILIEGTVPIAGRQMEEIIEAKLTAAGSRIGEVLDLIEAGAAGREQGTGGSYLSMKQYQAMSDVADPTTIDRHELERRIAAFGAVTMPLPGGPGGVTGLARGRGLGWPGLTLADGPVTVNRIGGTPAVLHLVWRTVRSRLRSVPRSGAG
jgi:methionyl-tRNA formyltransferase